MAGFAFVLLWIVFGVISSIVNRFRSNKQFTHEVPSALTPIFIYWLALLFGMAIVSVTMDEVLPESVIKECVKYFILLIFISPFLTSRVFIALGWVKTSFRFAELAYVINRKSPFAAGLFAGYLATKKVKNEEKRQTQLRWLRNQYLTIPTKQKLFSGEIVVFIFLDCALTHPGNNDYLVKRLKTVAHLPSASISKPIANYAIKRSLANVFPSNNWEQVIKVLQIWGNISTNLTNYINTFYKKNITNEKSSCFVPLFIRSLLAFRYTAIKQWCNSNLPLSQNSQNTIGNSNDAIKQIWYTNKALNDFSDANKNTILTTLTNGQQQLKWESRAKELGVYNQSFWSEITKKLEVVLKDAQLSEEQQKFIDDQHQALKYIEQNIRKKWDANGYNNSAEESVDWLQFLFVFNRLSFNKNEQVTAFTIYSGFLWDAMAGFWNNPNEYRLAYMLAAMSAPYAHECGLDDFQKTINFILSK